MKYLSKLLPIALIASLTLGLAPFTPQPHVLEKIKWLLEGKKTLAMLDWFDLLMHGTPWVFLVLVLIAKVSEKKTD